MEDRPLGESKQDFSEQPPAEDKAADVTGPLEERL